MSKLFSQLLFFDFCRDTAGKFEIEGFPTFLYFKNGKFAWKVEERTEDGFYNFMKK